MNKLVCGILTVILCLSAFGALAQESDLPEVRWTFPVSLTEIQSKYAVLVNADTYSAAEFFAAELQEQGAAVIVGEPTSGKGYSQQTFPLPHGGAVAISTGAYFTGSGASLIGTGLTLDAEVYNTGAEDAQLAAALELLEIR